MYMIHLEVQKYETVKSKTTTVSIDDGPMSTSNLAQFHQRNPENRSEI